jgi:hypothetical protein
VLVNGTVSSPSVVDSRRVELSDPANPDARQPYHAGFGTARSGGRALSTLVASVKRFGRKSVRDLIRNYGRVGHDVHSFGVVVGSLIDPATIANDHIRIHALEGQLFRGVIVDVADRSHLACSIWRERDLYGVAAKTLGRSEGDLRKRVASLGREVEGSWRAEHKAAALAAWLVLSQRQ